MGWYGPPRPPVVARETGPSIIGRGHGAPRRCAVRIGAGMVGLSERVSDNISLLPACGMRPRRQELYDLHEDFIYQRPARSEASV